MPDWQLRRFESLTVMELYGLLQLRAQVFVVEQQCIYQDVDGHDPLALHLLGLRSGRLVACARILPPGVTFAEVSIGRVVTAPAVRGDGLGRALMLQALDACAEAFPGQPVRIGAQSHLQRFYAGLGFVTASSPYDEDGIEHVEMLLSPALPD